VVSWNKGVIPAALTATSRTRGRGGSPGAAFRARRLRSRCTVSSIAMPSNCGAATIICSRSCCTGSWQTGEPIAKWSWKLPGCVVAPTSVNFGSGTRMTACRPACRGHDLPWEVQAFGDRSIECVISSMKRTSLRRAPSKRCELTLVLDRRCDVACMRASSSEAMMLASEDLPSRLVRHQDVIELNTRRAARTASAGSRLPRLAT